MVQPAGVVEYTDCFSVEEKDSPNECLGYKTKHSDGETSVMVELWGIQNTRFITIAPESILARIGSN